MFFRGMEPQKIRSLLAFAKRSSQEHLRCADAVNVLLRYKNEELAEQLVRESYYYQEDYIVTALSYRCFSFAIYFYLNFQRSIVDKGTQIFEVCISRLKGEFENFEVYLFFIKSYLEKISFGDAEKFVKTIERLNAKVGDEANYITFSKNPIKICVLLIEILRILKTKSQTLQTKIEKQIADLYAIGLSIQAEVDDEQEMREIFFERDLEDRELIKIVSD